MSYKTFLIQVNRILNLSSSMSISTLSKPVGEPVLLMLWIRVQTQLTGFAIISSTQKEPACVRGVGSSALGGSRAHVNEGWRQRFDDFHPQGPQNRSCAMVKINLAPVAC